jgi:hypothetical protein
VVTSYLGLDTEQSLEFLLVWVPSGFLALLIFLMDFKVTLSIQDSSHLRSFGFASVLVFSIIFSESLILAQDERLRRA